MRTNPHCCHANCQLSGKQQDHVLSIPSAPTEALSSDEYLLDRVTALGLAFGSVRDEAHRSDPSGLGQEDDPADGWFPESVAAGYDSQGGANAPEVVRPVIDVLEDLAAGGPVLEFAVGTGRVAAPLAGRGLPCKRDRAEQGNGGTHRHQARRRCR